MGGGGNIIVITYILYENLKFLELTPSPKPYFFLYISVLLFFEMKYHPFHPSLGTAISFVILFKTQLFQCICI